MTTAHESATRFPFEIRELEVPAEFAVLRAERPVLRVELPFGGEGWLVSRYQDAKFVLGDPRFSRAATVNADVPRTSPPMTQPGNLLAMDPPEHTRLRKLVASAFTMKNIRRWQPRVDDVTATLVSGMRRIGDPVDLVEHFAMPLPVTVVCELLGVPAADRQLFQRFAEIVFSTTGASAEEMAQAGKDLQAYLIAHIGRRRKKPENDLISQLIAVHDEDEGRLSEEELLSMAGSILVAGHESTANEISNFVWTLLTHDLWSYLASHPEAVDTATEELLRHVAMGSGFSPPRIALEDVEVAGRLIPKGDAVIANLVSANRDEDVFRGADEVNLTREPNPHLSFGFGPHHCLGAQLARMELRTALHALLNEFPQLHFSDDKESVVWRIGTRARGPRKMMLSWLRPSH